MATKRESTIKLGSNTDKPRVWLEGRWLSNFGFKAGEKYRVEFGKGRVTIKVDDTGDRKISARRSNREGAIVDIQNLKLLDSFKLGSNLKVVATKGQIVVTPTKSLAKRAARVLAATAVSLFAGGGLGDVAAHGAGFATVAAVEVNPDYAEVWERNHTGRMYESPVEEVDFHEMAQQVGPVGVLLAGRPCEPYSTIRTLDRGTGAKRDKSLPPEAHELGHLDFFMLNAVDALNPFGVVIENVPGYLDAGSGHATQAVLRAMGYHVEAKVINSLDYGYLTARKRAIIVATTADTIKWPVPITTTLTAASILSDNIPDDSPLWFGEDHWAAKHWAKQSAKGNGFAAPAINAHSTSIPTLKKRYFAGQGDNFVVAHPRVANMWRWLTLEEAARMMNLPANYDLGPTKTTAGEILGQGVVVGLIQHVVQLNFAPERIVAGTPPVSCVGVVTPITSRRTITLVA